MRALRIIFKRTRMLLRSALWVLWSSQNGRLTAEQTRQMRKNVLVGRSPPYY
eukprot:COSAG05_NODE_580_length_8553_cov_197.460934_2_plen_52_part_00